jgi:hypothetical protein
MDNPTQEVTQSAETPQETPKIATPTADELLVIANKQLTELQTKLGQTEKGLKTAHQTLTEKDRLLKQQQDFRSEMDEMKESIQIMAGLVAKGEMSPEQAQDAKNEFARMKQDSLERKRQTELKAQADVYNQRADAIYQKAQEVLDEDGIADVVAHLKAGNPDLAERKIAKATKGVKPVEEKKPEVVDEKTLREKMKKEIMAELGLLNTETGQPSGKGMTKDKAYAEYAAGRMDATEARKHGVTF